MDAPSGRHFDPTRLLARVLCAVFGLVGLLPLAAELLLGLDRVQNWAADRTAQLLRQELGVEARYDVRVHLIPLRLRIEHLVVPASDGGGPALTVERVSVSPRVFSLLAGRLDAGDVEVEAPRARLVIAEGALKNIRYRLPKSQKPAAKSKQPPFGSLSVSDGRFLLDIDGTRVDTGLMDLDVFTESGPVFEVMLSSSLASVTRARHPIGSRVPTDAPLAHDADALCRVDLRARFDGQELLVRRLSALGVADLDPSEGAPPSCEQSANAPSRVALRLSQLRLALHEGRPPTVSGHVVTRLPLGLGNRFLRTSPLLGWVGFTGDLRVDGKAKLPEIHGRVSGAGVALGKYRLASELGVDVHVSRDVIRVPRYEMVFADGHVVAQGGRIEPFAPGVPITLERVDGKGMLFESLMRDLDVTPNTIIRWALTQTHVTNLKGTLSPVKIDADLAADTRDFEVFDRAFHDPARRHMVGVKGLATVRGKIGVRPQALLFYDTRAEFGKSSMNVKMVSVGFDNQLGLEIPPGSRLHLPDISPLVDLPLQGEAELDVSMGGLASNPLLTGNLRIANLDFAGFPIGDIKSSKVKFRPLWLEITDAVGKKGSSDFVVPSARLDFGTRASVLVEGRVSSESMDLRDFFAMWHFDDDPRFDPLRGRTALDASLRYVLGGPEDHCGGGVLRTAGKLKAHGLDIFEERYDGGDANFDFLWHDRNATYRGVVLSIPEFSLRKGKGVLSGKVNMQTGAKLHGDLVASGVPLERLDSLPRILRAAEGSVHATGTLSGTIDAMEADISGVVTPLSVGRANLPGSNFHVELKPSKRSLPSAGTTRCGQPISAPFDRAEYERDAPDGVFHVAGEFLGGQISVKDVQITRQRVKTVRGDVRLNAVDLGSLLELRPEVALDNARLNGRATGVMHIEDLNLGDQGRARGNLALTNLVLERGGYKAELLPGAAPLALGDRKLQIPKAALSVTTPRGVRATFDVAGTLDKLGPGATLDAALDLRPTPLSGLVGLMPRVERAGGTLSGHFRLQGPASAPRTSGGLDIDHGELNLRGLPSPINDIQLSVAIGEGELTITHGSARVGGGSLALSGGAPISGFSLGEVRVRAQLHEVALPLKDGIRAAADADLLVNWKPARENEEPTLPRVSGNVLLRSFEYKRPVTLAADLNALAQRGKRTEFEAYDPSEGTVEFDVTLRAQRSLKIQNDLVDADLVLADEGLELAGTNARFGLRGTLRLKPGGHVLLRRSDFEIREGTVRFDDLTRIAPRVDVSAVTEYRRYSESIGSGAQGSSAGTSAASSGVTGGRWAIRMHAHGDADNLHVDLTSDPALPQDDIFLLLTVGLTRAELDQAQSASVGESVALEALGTLTGADRAVKNAVPIIDEFRFGSAYSSRTGRTEPTVTVGKRLTERVRANVTSGLAETREVRSNVEWRLSPRVSVEGSYDNVNDISSSSLGNLGADVRWRIEFE
ncbi:MAG TPA: translocation/assembly module TamB domain-containing protein [Polyangiaceae bacterium]|nr:translocation/assembly module TamB domain-containing protein [Polyangiaceae bacterium]